MNQHSVTNSMILGRWSPTVNLENEFAVISNIQPKDDGVLTFMSFLHLV